MNRWLYFLKRVDVFIDSGYMMVYGSVSTEEGSLPRGSALDALKSKDTRITEFFTSKIDDLRIYTINDTLISGHIVSGMMCGALTKLNAESSPLPWKFVRLKDGGWTEVGAFPAQTQKLVYDS